MLLWLISQSICPDIMYKSMFPYLHVVISHVIVKDITYDVHCNPNNFVCNWHGKSWFIPFIIAVLKRQPAATKGWNKPWSVSSCTRTKWPCLLPASHSFLSLQDQTVLTHSARDSGDQFCFMLHEANSNKHSPVYKVWYNEQNLMNSGPHWVEDSKPKHPWGWPLC